MKSPRPGGMGARREGGGGGAPRPGRAGGVGARGGAGDPERRPAALEGFGLERHALELGEAPVEGDVILGPELAQDPHRLVGAGAALVDGDADGLELLRVLATDAYAEDDAAAGDDVHGGDLLAGQGGRAEG